jgi:hypothetical protein
MKTNLMEKLFDASAKWHGPCTILLQANASVRSPGPDSILTGGAKVYAPRITSGRIYAHTVCFLRDMEVLVLIERRDVREKTGVDKTIELVSILDIAQIIGIEYEEIDVLQQLGIPAPPISHRSKYSSETLVG